MKSSYDAEADALYIRFSDGEIDGSQEVAPGVVLDYDAENHLVGLEVLNASAKMAAGSLPVAAE
jgi:uncharacterized protein YuzE